MSKKESGEKMISFTLRIPPGFLDKVREKAGMIPIAKIIRRLLEKWLSGEIDLN